MENSRQLRERDVYAFIIKWLQHTLFIYFCRLRILRYDPGDFFKPHYDGSYRRDNGERSYITIQLYLNEVKSYVDVYLESSSSLPHLGFQSCGIDSFLQFQK